MDLAEIVKEYISGVDIINGYRDYKKIFGNDFYNKFLASTQAIGRVIFDSSAVISVKNLAEGDEKNAGIAAFVSAAIFLVDYGIKKSAKSVICYKLNKKHTDSSV
jgi:hypothetical protein